MTTIDHSSIDLFKQHLTLRGRQPSTVESYGRDCATFIDFLDTTGVHLGEVSPEILSQFQEYLIGKGIRGNSVRRTVIGVRQFFRFLQDKHQWDRSPLDETLIPEREESFLNRVSDEIFHNLLRSAKSATPELKSRRDVVILALLGIEGLKVHEMIELEWRDFLYTSTSALLAIRGDRARTIQLEAISSEALALLRMTIDDLLDGRPSNPHSKIMIGFKGTTASYVIPNLTRHGVKFALYELGITSKIPQLNSEELRHHAMAHKVAIGLSPEALMNHLGLRTLGKTAAHFAATNTEAPPPSL